MSHSAPSTGNNPQGFADINTILQRPYTVKIVDYLNRGAAILKQNLGGFVVFTIAAFFISWAFSILEGVAWPTNIFFVIFRSLINGLLVAGYYTVALRTSREQSTKFDDFFLGFSNRLFFPIILVTFLTQVIVSMLFAGTFVALFLGDSSLAEWVTQTFPYGNFSHLTSLTIPAGLKLPLVALGVILFILAAYLNVGYLFAPLLVIDRRLGAWQAMEVSRKLVQKQWLAWLGFSIVMVVVGLSGILAFCVGILLTVPLANCMLAAAYEDIFGLGNNLPE